MERNVNKKKEHFMKVNNVMVDLKDLGSDIFSFSILATITNSNKKINILGNTIIDSKLIFDENNLEFFKSKKPKLIGERK
jgi:hypothetical protein